jgi:LCP family protein required for cell wall assembly
VAGIPAVRRPTAGRTRSGRATDRDVGTRDPAALDGTSGSPAPGERTVAVPVPDRPATGGRVGGPHEPGGPAPTGRTASRTGSGAAPSGSAPHADRGSASRSVVGPARDDIGTGAQDVSEQAERTRRTERTGAVDVRSDRIDETLTRLTAAHAGLTLPERDGAEEPAERRRRPRAVPLLVLTLAVAVLATTAVGWAAQRWLGSAVRNVAALDADSGAIRDAEAQKGDRNVLVVTTDKGPATVVVAHIPAGGGPLTVLSVPADLEINRPPCERFDPAADAYTDEIVPALGRTRLATALDAGGPRCVTRVVQQLTGLAVTGYVGVDLDHMAALVDAASGVRVCVTRPVQDRVLGPVVANPGTVTLDGARAGDFVRAADVDGDPPAGLGRIERQQQVLAGVLGTTLTSAGLVNLARIAALRPALGAALTTDGPGLDQVLALALSLRALDAGGVTFAPVPTAPGSRGDELLRDADAAALFTALRTHAPLPSGDADEKGPAPGDVTVQVLNASGRTGVAAGTGDTLKSLGFRIGTVSNADQPTPQTVIRYSPDQAAHADLLGGTVPAAALVPDPGSSGVLQLVLGRSFDGVIRAPAQPAAGASPVAPTQSCT